MKKKILILYATYGTGHRSIARYVEEYFKSQNEEIEIKNIDILSYVMPLINVVSTKFSNKVILSGNPLLWGMIYKYFDSKVTTFGTYRLLSKMFDTEKIKNEIVDYNPDLTISTHFFASTVISRYKRKNYIDSKLITIITDYQSHELWLQNKKSENALIVASKEEKKEMIEKGVDAEKIKIYGIPISGRFSDNYDRDAILKEYGFSGTRPIYLFFGGGGVGSKTSLPYLKELIKLDINADIIYVAGDNKKLKNKAQKIVEKNECNNIRVFGFINNVPQFMTISAAVITKPGGITITECLCLKKPMILINKTAGHEKGNFKYLVKNGFAFNASSISRFRRTMITVNRNQNVLLKIHQRLNKHSESDEAMKKLYNLSMELLNSKK